jgi:zinc D-Ala-D-Ala carboxypeptidase
MNEACMKIFSTLSSHVRFVTIALSSALVMIGMGLWLEFQPDPSLSSGSSAPSTSSLPNPVSALPSTPQAKPSALKFATIKPSPSVSPQTSPQPLPQAKVALAPVKSYFGHLSYQEDDPSRLETVGRFVRGTYERPESLDFEANQAFHQMAAVAKSEGVFLMPISGFRTISDQRELFEKQIERKGSPEAAARWSAPPGHSEHHTGYAIDIADERQSDTDLKIAFEETTAYRWLQANARNYGFEESFPQNNKQGVSYEPWHWRYIASPRASEIFSIAKSIS